MTDFTMTIDWGARSEALRKLHSKLDAKKSFLLVNAPLPVSLGIMEVTETGFAPEVAPVAPIIINPIKGTFSAKALIPGAASYLRLDFKLQVKVDKATATCLEFRQLFSVGAGGALLPKQYFIADFVFKSGSPAPTRVRGSAASGWRTFLGTCPLLKVSVNRVEINCEFLDVTELWWTLWASKDQWGWYLDPDLGGRPDLLRVLAWTSGTAPMLWFVAISDFAATGRQPAKVSKAQDKSSAAKQRPGADVVFFRPLTGLNSFFYKADESGFLEQEHGNKTMFNLARWLLSPLPIDKLKVKQAAVGTNSRPFRIELTSMRILPAKPPPNIDPKDPIDRMAQDVLWAFRLVGLEGALSRSPSPDMVFLPLGFGGFKGPFEAGGGYTALLMKDALRDVIDSARALLWVQNATGRELTSTPRFERQLWLAGHSAQNRQMFQCLLKNARHIDRILSYEATPAKDILLPEGVPKVTAAADMRKKDGKTLKAIFITTPNMWIGHEHEGVNYQSIEKKLIATKADVVMLPLNTEWDAYWKHPPDATSNPHLFEVLREWENNGLATSKQFGTVKDGWQWLFWHEWAVHGGHVVFKKDAKIKDAKIVDHVQTFFEDILNML